MRITKVLGLSVLLGLAACAHQPPEGKEISLQVSEYKEGDRTALLRVENHTSHYLSYHGPYVEFRTNQEWTPYRFEVPEMNVLGRPHRLGPAQNDSWWVRLPESNAAWRSYIEGGWLAHAGTPAEPEQWFKVFSEENLRDSGK
jgi:hypothetical protein